jgi:uncharacterized damage-inducible protein DinB
MTIRIERPCEKTGKGWVPIGSHAMPGRKTGCSREDVSKGERVMSEVHELVRRLEDSMRESFDKILEIPEDYLDHPCRHGCARGRHVWDLLTHNIEHERMHTGQIIGVRDAMDRLQQDRKSKLIAELYLARATLIASLLGLEDSDLDATPKEGEWSIRQTLEHVLYWDRNSIDDLLAQYSEESEVARS